MTQDILQEILNEQKRIQVLIRTNNLLLSRFILELDSLKSMLDIPKRLTFFRFELLKSEYEQLINEFNQKDVDAALTKLDRILLLNKQNCPNNIAKYIRTKLIKKKTKRNETR